MSIDWVKAEWFHFHEGLAEVRFGSRLVRDWLLEIQSALYYGASAADGILVGRSNGLSVGVALVADAELVMSDGTIFDGVQLAELAVIVTDDGAFQEQVIDSLFKKLSEEVGFLLVMNRNSTWLGIFCNRCEFARMSASETRWVRRVRQN